MNESKQKNLMKVPVATLLGHKVGATYLDHASNPTKMYRGNPFIEALPPVYTRQQVATALKVRIDYDDEERNLEAHHRIHCVQSALHFFQPLPIHFDLQEKLSRAVRGGYLPRNPTDPNYYPKIRDAVAGVEDFSSLPTWDVVSQMKRSPFGRRLANGFAVIGWPGLGKTTSIDEILTRLYPQVIVHKEYKGNEVSVEQLVWLKMDLPHDGSLRGLCDGFFASVDEVLGKSYRSFYVRRSKGANVLIFDMANVALLHGLGVLVIDELQHLREASSGGINGMMNFFVTLSNALKLPIVLVGTPRAVPLLTKEFRLIRRAEGQGDLIFERMAFDAVWQKFVTELWKYEYTRYRVELSEKLSKCLHYASQGITDIAVKIFILAQIRAIVTNEERLTESIINSVTDDSLRLAAPVLTALREGKEPSPKDYDDLAKIELGSLIMKTITKNSIELAKASTPNEDTDTDHDPIVPSDETTKAISPAIMSAPPAITESSQASKEKNRNKSTKKNNIDVGRPARTKKHRPITRPAAGGMPAITDGIVDPSGEKTLSALRDAGLNRSADEFIEKEIT